MTPIEQTLYEVLRHLQAALPDADPDTPVLELLGRLTGQRDAARASQSELLERVHMSREAERAERWTRIVTVLERIDDITRDGSSSRVSSISYESPSGALVEQSPGELATTFLDDLPVIPDPAQ